MLFRDEAQLGQLPLEEATAEESSRTDPHGALQKVITAAEWILGGIEEEHQTIALIVLEAMHPEPWGDRCHGSVDGHGDQGCQPLPGQS